MSQQLTTKQDNGAIREALKTSLYPGASDEAVDMVLAYCKAGGLDPLTKPVHIVPMWVPEKKVNGQVVRRGQTQDVVMPGIELYRTKAHRTGEYAGQDEAEFGPTEEALGIVYPEWCRVTVYKLVQGVRVAFSAKVYWVEAYATAGKDTDAPNAMWKKRPFGQIEKCAEALALRKAFPEAVGAQPTADEMIGKAVIEGEATPVQRSAAIEQKPAELPAYDPEQFTANLSAWKTSVLAGKATPNGLINMISTKYRLTDEQKKAIRDLEVADDAGGDIPSDFPPGEYTPGASSNPDFPLEDE